MEWLRLAKIKSSIFIHYMVSCIQKVKKNILAVYMQFLACVADLDITNLSFIG